MNRKARNRSFLIDLKKRSMSILIFWKIFIALILFVIVSMLRYLFPNRIIQKTESHSYSILIKLKGNFLIKKNIPRCNLKLSKGSLKTFQKNFLFYLNKDIWKQRLLERRIQSPISFLNRADMSIT